MDDLQITTTKPAHVTVSSFGGAVPVQGYGTIQALFALDEPRFWYFRARGNGWSLTVGDDAGEGYVAADEGADLCVFGDWGDRPYAAGWMSLETAYRLAGLALSLWLDGVRGEFEVRNG